MSCDSQWLSDESGTWVAQEHTLTEDNDTSHLFMPHHSKKKMSAHCKEPHTRNEVWFLVWGAFDNIVKLDAIMCNKFGTKFRSWFDEVGDRQDDSSIVQAEAPPSTVEGSAYFDHSLLDSDAEQWDQHDVELTRREIVHYLRQPALPTQDGGKSGKETTNTDFTGSMHLRLCALPRILRGLRMLARNYWSEALGRFAYSDRFQQALFINLCRKMDAADASRKASRKVHKLRHKMRRTMRKLCQRLLQLHIALHGVPCPPKKECKVPHREARAGAPAGVACARGVLRADLMALRMRNVSETCGGSSAGP